MTLVSNLPGMTAFATSKPLESAADPASESSTETAGPSTQATAVKQGADQATFSNLALQLSQASSTAITQFPGRPGFSTAALALAATNTDLTGSSKGLSFAEVASDARARMDDKYAQMQASGTPYNANSNQGRDTYSLLGDLDRRSLYAVSSNKDGLFSEAEQMAATAAMARQHGIAMGLYEGGAAFTADPARAFKAGLDFLNNVSAEEKGSAEWLHQHMKLEANIAELEQQKKPKELLTLFEILAQMYAEQARKQQEESGTEPETRITATPGTANHSQS